MSFDVNVCFENNIFCPSNVDLRHLNVLTHTPIPCGLIARICILQQRLELRIEFAEFVAFKSGSNNRYESLSVG